MNKNIDVQYLKYESNLVINKITESIYEIEKDRGDSFSGTVYLTSDDVVNALNNCLKVSLYEGNEFLHANFKTELVIRGACGVLIAAKD